VVEGAASGTYTTATLRAMTTKKNNHTIHDLIQIILDCNTNLIPPPKIILEPENDGVRNKTCEFSSEYASGGLVGASRSVSAIPWRKDSACAEKQGRNT